MSSPAHLLLCLVNAWSPGHLLAIAVHALAKAGEPVAQIVFAVLGSWAVGIYTASTVFGGKKPTEGGQASSEQPTGAAGPAAPAPAQ